MKKTVLNLSVIIGVFLFTSLGANAQEININIVNNVPQQAGYSSNIMCTLNGGMCVNDRYLLSTGRMRYVAPQWKRLTLREQRLLSTQNIREGLYTR